MNWLNSDTLAHTATDAGVFDTGSIAPTSAADAPVLFNSVGTFNYHCTLHANETASIVVTGSPLVQRVGQDWYRLPGSFRSVGQRWFWHDGHCFT